MSSESAKIQYTLSTKAPFTRVHTYLSHPPTAQVLLRLSVKVDEPVASKPMELPAALVEAVAQEDADSEGGGTWYLLVSELNQHVGDLFLMMGFRVLLHV